jgi:hypothetical protein
MPRTVRLTAHLLACLATLAWLAGCQGSASTAGAEVEAVGEDSRPQPDGEEAWNEASTPEEAATETLDEAITPEPDAPEPTPELSTPEENVQEGPEETIPPEPDTPELLPEAITPEEAPEQADEPAPEAAPEPAPEAAPEPAPEAATEAGDEASGEEVTPEAEEEVVVVPDECPDDPDKLEPGACGCGVPDLDDDGDQAADCLDNCPGLPNPGQDDADHDGAGNPCDGCPGNPAKTAPGVCGCGAPDSDRDGDGALDCQDGCPLDGLKIEPGQCGCGQPDTPHCDEVEPPLPDPAEWAEPPHASGTHSVAMRARAAADPSGVEYYFACTAGACHDSGWQDGEAWEDLGLIPGTQYAWRVTARDRSLNQNQCLWSAEAAAFTDPDVTPPTPDPAEWEVQPHVTGPTSVAMSGGEAWDEAGVEYRFECVLGQCHDSGWQAGREFEDQGLAPGTQYAWRVRTRDLSPQLNQAAPSEAASAVTDALVPGLVGLEQAAAEAALIGVALVPGQVDTAYSEAAPAGTVLAQDPAAGTVLPAGSSVSLVVSLGPRWVVLSELMYHPQAELAREEFLELYNPFPEPISLEGWVIDGLGRFTFPAGASIQGHGFLVLAEDAAAFKAEHGFAPDHAWVDASLSNGGEVLKVLRADGSLADELEYHDLPPWPVTPDGLGPSLELIDPDADNNTPRAWHASIAPTGATPRAVNSVDADGLPPWITEVSHGLPEADLPLTVTARVEDAQAVTLSYVIDWGVAASLPMTDDGLNGDGAAGDGVWGVTLPGQPLGSMVRYRLDASGPTGLMGAPRDDDTLQYLGTYLAPPAATDLEVLHWLIQPQDYADALNHLYTDQTEPALLFHRGVLYDGVQIRVRGQSSRGWPKKHWNFKFAKGHGFNAVGFTVAPVNGFNLQSSWADKSYLREILSYETFRDAGSPSHHILPVTVYQNGQFFGLYSYLEDANPDQLQRNGLDPDGALYKAFGSQCEYKPLAQLPGPWEKESPDDGDFSDLHAFLWGFNQLAGQARRDFLLDQVNLPDLLNYHAASVLIHNNDQVAKNYFLYRDTFGTGRWTMQAWDMDLTFGRSFQGTVLNDQIFASTDVVPGRANVSPSHPLFGDSEHQKWDYLWNRLIDVVLEDPDLRLMYYRRLRTLADTLLVEGRYEARIDQLAALIADEAQADRAKWGWYGAEETPAQAVTRLETEYLGPRRTHLLVTHRVDGEVPEAQSAHPQVVINELMYSPYVDPANPADTGADLEFVELYNPSATEAVDLSGWHVTGVGLTIPGGTVILPGAHLLLVRHDVLFRARYGGGRFIAARYSGKLDNGGERVALEDRLGALVDEVQYDDLAPWPVAADGTGLSLELLDPGLDNSQPYAWAASLVDGGTPGAKNSVAP